LSITIFAPAPGGGTSNAVPLTMTGPSLAVSATTPPPGTPISTTVTNPPATPSSWIALAAVGAANSTYLQYTFLDSLPGTTTKTWTVTLPIAVGQYEVRLFDGLTYNRIATCPTITVANISPTPSLASLAPTSVAAGSPGFALAVTGSGFVSAAIATVGGQPRTVTVSSPTQLFVAVLSGDVASQGNVAMQVTNPAACVSGLCVSNAITLSVIAPPAHAPSSVSPSTVARDVGDRTLTATGANFMPSSVVQINGSPRITSFVGATQLTATILASDIATPAPVAAPRSTFAESNVAAKSVINEVSRRNDVGFVAEGSDPKVNGDFSRHASVTFKIPVGGFAIDEHCVNIPSEGNSYLPLPTQRAPKRSHKSFSSRLLLA
jgi:hypothetical protein